jgi:hypothetical protein
VSVVPRLLVVLIGLAVLAAGTLPPTHLHHLSNAVAPFVHAHFEANHRDDGPSRFGDPHQRSVSGTDHDPAQTTVGLGQAVGASPTVRSHYAPLLVCGAVPSPGFGAPRVVGSAPSIERTLSPPSRQSSPRAPPA